MKYTHLLFIPFVSILYFACNTSQKVISNNTPLVENNCALDSLLQTVEKDQYGMQKYVIAYLKRGPNRDRSPEEAAELQKAHMENIGKMAEEGKLVLAGPFLDDGDIRGLYIFNVPTIEEAKALTATDPAIQAGSLEMELVPWYGSAALQTLTFMHYQLEAVEISDDL